MYNVSTQIGDSSVSIAICLWAGWFSF